MGVWVGGCGEGEGGNLWVVREQRHFDGKFIYCGGTGGCVGVCG